MCTQLTLTSFINYKFIFKYCVLYCTDFIAVFYLFLGGWRDEEGGRIKGRKKMLESIPLALCDSFVKNNDTSPISGLISTQNKCKCIEKGNSIDLECAGHQTHRLLHLFNCFVLNDR